MSDSYRKGKMRVIVDANVLISYLLKPDNLGSTIRRAVRLVLTGQFQIIVPEQLVTELRDAPNKPKFIGRLPHQDVERFVTGALTTIGTVVPPERVAIPRGGRDPKDRYLLEAAILHDVDILVSGDKDLLALAPHLDLPRIMSPAQFVAEFGEG